MHHCSFLAEISGNCMHHASDETTLSHPTTPLDLDDAIPLSSCLFPFKSPYTCPMTSGSWMRGEILAGPFEVTLYTADLETQTPRSIDIDGSVETNSIQQFGQSSQSGDPSVRASS